MPTTQKILDVHLDPEYQYGMFDSWQEEFHDFRRQQRERGELKVNWVPPLAFSSRGAQDHLFQDTQKRLKERTHYVENDIFISKFFPNVSSDDLTEVKKCTAVVDQFNELEKMSRIQNCKKTQVIFSFLSSILRMKSRSFLTFPDPAASIQSNIIGNSTG